MPSLIVVDHLPDEIVVLLPSWPEPALSLLFGAWLEH
jgi:hypothetical protein